MIALGALLFLAAAGTEAGSSPVFSDASLSGTYELSVTVRPYIKFGGGPRVGSGELHLDGHGGLSGATVFFGERQNVRGTYHVNADGGGTMNFDVEPPTDPANRVELELRISGDKVDIQSPGSENRDWSSVANELHQTNGGLVGELRRKSN